jgi:acetolactate synthase-1/2/3 large subunit
LHQINTLISNPAQFELKLSAAIISAMGSLTGPELISVPRDVMTLPASEFDVSYHLNELLNRPDLLDSEAVEKLYQQLLVAKKVVFIIGDEACDAIGSILSLAVDMGSDILVTPQGKELVSSRHPL